MPWISWQKGRQSHGNMRIKEIGSIQFWAKFTNFHHWNPTLVPDQQPWWNNYCDKKINPCDQYTFMLDNGVEPSLLATNARTKYEHKRCLESNCGRGWQYPMKDVLDLSRCNKTQKKSNNPEQVKSNQYLQNRHTCCCNVRWKKSQKYDHYRIAKDDEREYPPYGSCMNQATGMIALIINHPL